MLHIVTQDESMIEKLFKYISISISIFIFIPLPAISGIQVAPAYIDLGTTKPGEEKKIMLTISNTGNNSEIIQIKLIDPAKDDNENWQYSKKADESRSLQNWMKIKGLKFELRSMKTIVKEIIIKVPKKAVGDYRTTIAVQQSKKETIAKQKAKLEAMKFDRNIVTQTILRLSRIAIPVHIRVIGKDDSGIENEIKLKASDVKYLESNKPMIAFDMDLKNFSKYRIKSSGTCEILSDKKDKIYSNEFNSVEVFSLENTSFKCQFHKYLPKGKYKFRVKVASYMYRGDSEDEIIKTKNFKISSKDAELLSNYYSKKTSKKVMVPLTLDLDHITNNDGEKRLKIRVKNISGQDQVVRPFFLEMPKSKVTKKIRFEPNKFRVKAYSFKDITIKIKKNKKTLYGKLVFSSVEHKDKIPLTINYLSNYNEGNVSYDDLVMGDINISPINDKVEVFRTVKNEGNSYLVGISYKLDVLTPNRNVIVTHDSLFSKTELLPGESTDIRFRIDPLEDAKYILKTSVLQSLEKNEVISNENILEVSNVDENIRYDVIDE